MLKTGFNKFSTKIDRNAILLLLPEMRGKIAKHFSYGLFYCIFINGYMVLYRKEKDLIRVLVGIMRLTPADLKLIFCNLQEIMLLREIFCRSNQTQPVQWKPSKSSFAPLLTQKAWNFLILSQQVSLFCHNFFFEFLNSSQKQVD